MLMLLLWSNNRWWGVVNGIGSSVVYGGKGNRGI